MALPVTTLSNKQTFLRYPPLPSLPEDADEPLVQFHKELTDWYDDLTQLLQNDREAIYTAISKITP